MVKKAGKAVQASAKERALGADRVEDKRQMALEAAWQAPAESEPDAIRAEVLEANPAARRSPGIVHGPCLEAVADRFVVASEPW